MYLHPTTSKKKNKRSLVTGGAGFIGSHVVDRLINYGHEVVVVDDFSTGYRENLNKKAKNYNTDITNRKKIRQIFKKHNFNGMVVHCAARARINPSFSNKENYFDTNVVGLFNVMEEARKYNIDKFVFCSSSSVYGERGKDNRRPMKESDTINPGSPYSIQKALGEYFIQQYSKIFDLPSVICRFFNVYGERQITTGKYATVIGIWLKQAEKGRPLSIVEPGTQERDFTYVHDISRGLLLAGESEFSRGEIFNLGSGVTYPIKEVAQLISKRLKYLPPRRGDYLFTKADITKAYHSLGFSPHITNIKEGINLCKEKQ